MENRAIEWKAVEWRKMTCANIPLLKRINESLLSPGEIVTLSSWKKNKSKLELQIVAVNCFL
jgi:hypothetical protein